MTYIVIQSIEIEAKSPAEAVERAAEFEAHEGAARFVQKANKVTRAAVETALEGAIEIHEA